MGINWVAISIASIISLIFWSISLSIRYRVKYLKQTSTKEVFGEIIEQKYIQNGGENKGAFVTVINYTINNRDYSKNFQIMTIETFLGIPFKQKYPRFSKGEKIKLFYNPNNILQIIVSESQFVGHKIAAFIFSVFATFSTLFTFLLIGQPLNLFW